MTTTHTVPAFIPDAPTRNPDGGYVWTVVSGSAEVAIIEWVCDTSPGDGGKWHLNVRLRQGTPEATFRRPQSVANWLAQHGFELDSDSVAKLRS